MIIEHKGHKPDIHESCFITDNVTIIGNVTLKRNVSIWYGTVVRGDNNYICIGENTNIQDNCTIHINYNNPTIIGDNVSIGHGVIVHACTVGNNVLIGMGAIVLDGAEIGDNVIIGAGTLIPPGKKIPSNTLVMGTTMKIVRELNEKDKEKIAITAIHYLQYAQEYNEAKICPSL